MDFGSFLHNKYGHPTPEEKRSILKFTSRENYNADEELHQLVLKYFGDIDLLHESGLRHSFFLLEKEVREKQLIGLILYGADKSNKTVHINDYTDINYNNIKITVQSVCNLLLDDYIKSDNIEDLVSNDN